MAGDSMPVTSRPPRALATSRGGGAHAPGRVGHGHPAPLARSQAPPSSEQGGGTEAPGSGHTALGARNAAAKVPREEKRRSHAARGHSTRGRGGAQRSSWLALLAFHAVLKIHFYFNCGDYLHPCYGFVPVHKTRLLFTESVFLCSGDLEHK